MTLITHRSTTLLSSSLIALFAAAATHAQGTLFSRYGATCGPVHDGTIRYAASQRWIVLSVDMVPSNSPTVLVFGISTTSAIIPGGCPLHVMPIAVVPISIDSQGSGVFSLFGPVSTSLSAFYSQSVSLDPTMRWLSSNGVAAGPFTGAVTVTEDFKTQASLDPDLTGAVWSNGKVVPAELGGSGVLGEFRARDGRDTATFDNAGRRIYEFDVDSLVVPASSTLTGTPIKVTSGVLEYANFRVAANEHVRFVGTKPVVLRVVGTVRVDGVVDLHVGEFSKQKPTDPMPPRLGGAGGGSGGEIPSKNLPIAGADGGDVVVPRGHPRAGQSAGTGGKGSSAFPATGKDVDVVWIMLQNFRIFVRQMSAGGGGGSLFDAGAAYAATGGNVVRTATNPILGPYTAAEFPAPTLPGLYFPVLPEVASLASVDTFLLGGAGGGGTGTHAAYTAVVSNYVWSHGGGGAAGGGAIAVRSGGDISVDGELRARGAAGATITNSSGQPPAITPGGAGSGGSVLLQSVRSVAAKNGAIDVRGGFAGNFYELTPLIEVAVNGGKGSAGYWRAESLTPPRAGDFPQSLPPVDATKNLAVLRPADFETRSGAGSKWYRFRGNSRYLGYEIDARVDGNLVTFSDRDPFLREAKEGEAVVASFQSAQLDASGNVVVSTAWTTGTMKPINLDLHRGDAMRFFLSIDTSKTVTGNVEIVAVRMIAGS
ncbi:MAG: hypothetical protein H6832_18400 [Planctomycetes bacterium]|nr:hypothetical protein [Planctomycetota bacterium]MCB9891685.1 hypothetical protein [Planctomycetota bacterium]MCB9920379.1 hypothetical protein [Planctomycetota bacterium]